MSSSDPRGRMVRMTTKEVREFLNRRGVRKVGVHSWKPIKRMPWPFCSSCGLLRLKNDVTRIAANGPCITEE